MFKRKQQKLDEEFELYGINYYPEKKGFFGTLIQILLVILLMMIIGLLGLYGYNYLQNTTTKTPKVVSTPIPLPQAKPTSISNVVSNLLDNLNENSENQSYVQNLTAGNIDSVKEQNTITNTHVDTQAVIVNETVTANSNQIFFDPSEEAHMDKVAQLALKIKEMIENNQVTNHAIPAHLIHDSLSATTNTSDYAQSLSQEVQVREREMTSLVVKRGESLSMLAQRAYGNPKMFQTILDANPQLQGDPSRIFIGQRLRIPQ